VGLGAFALGSSLLVVALSPTVPIFLASMLYFGFAVVSYTTSSQALVQQASPPEISGRIMTLYVLGGMGTTPVGALIAGFIIDHISPRVAIGVGATSAMLVGLVLLLMSVRISSRDGGLPFSDRLTGVGPASLRADGRGHGK
jgi:MFS family permease